MDSTVRNTPSPKATAPLDISLLARCALVSSPPLRAVVRNGGATQLGHLERGGGGYANGGIGGAYIFVLCGRAISFAKIQLHQATIPPSISAR